MHPVCPRDSLDRGSVPRRGVSAILAMSGAAAVAVLLTACTRASTAEVLETAGHPAKEASEEEIKLEPTPAPEPTKKRAGLDPSAYYDPPTVDAKPPKLLTRSTSAPDFPNVILTTHEGKEVKFYEDLVKGKIVVINFMFATCQDT